MKLMKCPACGAPIQGQVTSRVVVCEYCDSKFILDDDTAAAVTSADEADSELDEYEEYYSQWESMGDFVRDACDEFLGHFDEDTFTFSKRIFDGLGVDDEDEVYLIHDDSLFGRGKNGFAISYAGMYCREMGESAGLFLDWESFVDYDEPYIDDTYIRANGYALCYYTNDEDMLPHLLDFYHLLYEASHYLAAEYEE